MASKQEQLIRDFLGAWCAGGEAFRPDIEKVLSMVTEDVVWHLWVPGPVIRGREALGKEIEREMTYTTQIKCTIKHIVASERVVITERDDFVISNGKPMPHSLATVFELDENGLISAWREYLDSADLARKIGVSPDELGGASLDRSQT